MLFRRGVAYCQDLRERVFAIADGGAGVNQTARLLMVSVSYVSKVLIPVASVRLVAIPNPRYL